MIQEGSVFYFKGSEPKSHYHIVILRDPSEKDKRSIVVYLSTSRTRMDDTCTFRNGDDFFITQDCWVRYRNCKIISDADLCKLEYIGVAKESTVKKIKDGFIKTLKTIQDDVRYTYENWRDDHLFRNM